MLLVTTASLMGQYTKEFKRIFFDADYMYETGFYQEALNRYKNLLTLDPGNSNILFHCGACCLQIPGNEHQAIAYLEESVKGVSQSYKDHSHSESGAPVLALFMLGRAYHLDNQFDKARRAYDLYLEIGIDQDPLQVDFARLQIEACTRAEMAVEKSPSFGYRSVLEYFDDDLPSCSNPVISGDGNTLIFLVDYPADKKIMMTVRDGESWSRPRVINGEIGMVGETYPTSLSFDGKALYMVHHFYSHSDIFVSRFEGGRWSEAEALDHNINGRTSEDHASISLDGETLYFTSDARGGSGSFDIYVSRMDDKGKWGPPANLGPVINTPYEEHTPFISANDSVLFFSSQGHASIGGIDVFYSQMNPDGTWGEPRNMGSPVNTTGDDYFYNPGWNELDGYYAVRREDDPTSNTIRMVFEVEPEEMATGSGVDDSIAMATYLADNGQPTQELPSLAMVTEPEVTDRVVEVLNGPTQEIEKEPAKVEIKTVPVVAVSPVRTVLQTIIPFDYNAYTLNLAAQLEVERLAELLNLNPETQVVLVGHSDATGPAGYNLLLSSNRVDQVARYLEMRGVERSRISVDSKGEASPLAKNKFPDGSDAPLGRYLNRNVEVTVNGPVSTRDDLAGLYIPEALKPDPSEGDISNQSFWFTIQLKAARSPMDLSVFKGISDIHEYDCSDQYYRYTTGAFNHFESARSMLLKVQEMGFTDAYIQTLEYYEGVKK